MKLADLWGFTNVSPSKKNLSVVYFR